MNYTTLQKLKRSFGDKAEIMLSDIKDSHITEIIKDSSRIIDGYIGIVYNTNSKANDTATIYGCPTIRNNAILDQVCIALARAEIYRRYAHNDIPAAFADAEKQAYSTLEKIQNKKIKLEADSEQPSADSRQQSAKRVFGSD